MKQLHNSSTKHMAIMAICTRSARESTGCTSAMHTLSRETLASPQMVNLHCMGCRGQGKEEDSRWLSGTYLLVHPASKHLGHARVRVKVLLELQPQGSGRANARHWQVPQIVPIVTQTDSRSPVEAALVGLAPDGTPHPMCPLLNLRQQNSTLVLCWHLHNQGKQHLA